MRGAPGATAAGMGAVLLCVGSLWARAQRDRAESTFPFEPWNAQAVAVGGAGVAAGGLAFLAVNPAAAAGRRTALVSYRRSPAGLRDYAVELAHRWSWGTLALAVRRRDWGEVASDLGLGDLTAGEQSLGAGYAHELLGGRLRWGVALSRLNQDFLGNRAGGWAADVGVQASLAGGLRAGAALLHMGEGMEASGSRDAGRLPSRARAGAEWQGRLGSFRVVALSDVAVPLRRYSGLDLHVGMALDYGAGPLVAGGRAGWRALADSHGTGRNETAVSFGGALGLGPVGVEIATAPRGAIGTDLVVSLSARW